MTQDKISALLGRPLSSLETANFNTYLSLAQSRVSDLLCSDICAEHETKSFTARVGYRTLNLPIFSEITSVVVDDNEVENYKAYQGSNLNGVWFNQIVFDELPDCKTIEIEADWGFYNVPLDVQLLVAEQFSMMSSSPLANDLIKSKQVEDFSVTFNGDTKQDAFAKKYAPTIAKYSGCVQGNVQHGATHGRIHFI